MGERPPIVSIKTNVVFVNSCIVPSKLDVALEFFITLKK